MVAYTLNRANRDAVRWIDDPRYPEMFVFHILDGQRVAEAWKADKKNKEEATYQKLSKNFRDKTPEYFLKSWIFPNMVHGIKAEFMAKMGFSRPVHAWMMAGGAEPLPPGMYSTARNAGGRGKREAIEAAGVAANLRRHQQQQQQQPLLQQQLPFPQQQQQPHVLQVAAEPPLPMQLPIQQQVPQVLPGVNVNANSQAPQPNPYELLRRLQPQPQPQPQPQHGQMLQLVQQQHPSVLHSAYAANVYAAYAYAAAAAYRNWPLPPPASAAASASPPLNLSHLIN